MSKKGDSSVPYIFDDEEMQINFHRNFFIRPTAMEKSFYLENFTTLPEVYELCWFQGWNDFLRISKDIYTWLVLAFYSTLPTDEDNTSLRSIVGSFGLKFFLLTLYTSPTLQMMASCVELVIDGRKS